jgi:hypothetical protein
VTSHLGTMCTGLKSVYVLREMLCLNVMMNGCYNTFSSIYWCLSIAFHCKIFNVVCTVDVIVLKFVVFSSQTVYYPLLQIRWLYLALNSFYTRKTVSVGQFLQILRHKIPEYRFKVVLVYATTACGAVDV